eukprot:CAMPEP_0198137882 /NCGR_PEP_ID=MMETSP1443-20131203/1326_1 /TAXON_ID=186043 /ORGANISM="Entomoneis sp., Strain CCMP2396" /LENGTH=97 /DNA_ID=CAMNT_0043799449 /DNA_START=206 /DNA_END=498 /DNA_ORIENTATION=-
MWKDVLSNGRFLWNDIAVCQNLNEPKDGGFVCEEDYTSGPGPFLDSDQQAALSSVLARIDSNAREKAGKACAHWKEEDRDESIFDVMATCNVNSAEA